MGRTRLAWAVVFMFATGNYLRTTGADLVNGGFETDGPIGDIRVQAPSGWDVNLPPLLFSGSVAAGEATEGNYALKLSANWLVTFAGGETGTVSQPVLLDDVGEIAFDLRLRTSGAAWDPNLCTAAVWIDEDVVWRSDFARADIRGDYPDQVCRVDDKYRDGQFHRLALGLQVPVNEMLFTVHHSYWDAVECRPLDANDGGTDEPNDTGGGDVNEVEFLPGDLNRDSFVNTDDLRMMAAEWLTEVPADSPYNLYTLYTGRPDADEEFTGIYTVNFFDLAVLARNWRAGPLPEP
jgi:hypothetical protein